MTSFTHSDMQWVFVHHLLRNEALLNSSGLLEHLRQSNAYFDEVNKIRQKVLSDDIKNCSVESEDQSAGGDTAPSTELFEGAALLERIEYLQDKAKRNEHVNEDIVTNLMEATKESVKNTARKAAKVSCRKQLFFLDRMTNMDSINSKPPSFRKTWNLVYEQCRRRIDTIRTQLKHVQEVSDAITSWMSVRKKASRGYLKTL